MKFMLGKKTAEGIINKEQDLTDGIFKNLYVY